MVPVYRDPNSPMPVTQFNMQLVEKAGLVKFDFLGLKTLTVLDTAVKLVAQRNIEVDLSNLPLDDKDDVRHVVARRDNRGVPVGKFRHARSDPQVACRTNIEDIIAIVALYRPGSDGEHSKIHCQQEG